MEKLKLFWHEFKVRLRIAERHVFTVFKYIVDRLDYWVTEKYPVLFIFILLGLFTWIYLFKGFQQADLPLVIKSTIMNVLDKSGFNGLNDALIKQGILSISKSLGVIFSLTITLYIFTYREQKSISPSASYRNDKNRPIIYFMIVLLSTMLYSYMFLINFGNKLEKSVKISLAISNAMYPLMIIWLILLLLSLWLVVVTIRNLFYGMSVNWMLKATIKETKNEIYALLKLMPVSISKILLKKKYKQLHVIIESIYQMLKYTAENNMNQEFEENITELREILKILQSSYETYEIDNVSTYLFHRDKEKYPEFMSTILRNNLSLINYLYKNQHFNKGKQLIDLYISIYSQNYEPKLKRQFIESLDDLLNSTDLNNTQQVKYIVSSLMNVSEVDTFIIYKNLIMRLIIQENVKLLTSVVYALKLHLVDGEYRKKSKAKKGIVPDPVSSRIKNSVVIILLQCLLKSIEISHYSSTGFLIKYIVTNFKSAELDEGLLAVRKSPYFFTSVYEEVQEDSNEEEKKDVPEFNQETFDYCLKKLYILLYAQQKFAFKHQLWFIKETRDQTDISFIQLEEMFSDCEYIPYIMSKINAAGNKYGLLFLQDKTFMTELINDIGISEEKIEEVLFV